MNSKIISQNYEHFDINMGKIHFMSIDSFCDLDLDHKKFM